jgi:hypothetical protein
MSKRKSNDWETANMTASYGFKTRVIDKEDELSHPVDNSSSVILEKASMLSEEAKLIIFTIFKSPNEFLNVTGIQNHFSRLWGSMVIVDQVIDEIKIWLKDK